MPSSTPIHAPDPSRSVCRAIPFVELMDLLEFSRLRLDTPAHPIEHDQSQATVIGTQDWVYTGQADLPPAGASDAPDIYICSTADALRQAVLPADETLIRFDQVVRYSHDIGLDCPGTATRGITLSMASLRDDTPDLGPQRYVRVDLSTLVSRVIVPPCAGAHLFELVNRVVRARIWVDVSRH